MSFDEESTHFATVILVFEHCHNCFHINSSQESIRLAGAACSKVYRNVLHFLQLFMFSDDATKWGRRATLLPFPPPKILFMHRSFLISGKSDNTWSSSRPSSWKGSSTVLFRLWSFLHQNSRTSDIFLDGDFILYDCIMYYSFASLKTRCSFSFLFKRYGAQNTKVLRIWDSSERYLLQTSHTETLAFGGRP